MLATVARMTWSPWLPIAVVWLVALLVGGVLWQRFTRVPVQSGAFTRSGAPATRRVLPLWLALVLLMLLIVAVWLTVRWGVRG